MIASPRYTSRQMLTGYVLIICHKHKLLFRYVDMFSFFCHSICKNSSWNSWLHPRHFTINHVNPILTIEGASLANHRDCCSYTPSFTINNSTTMFCWQVSNDSKHFHMVLSATLGFSKSCIPWSKKKPLRLG